MTYWGQILFGRKIRSYVSSLQAVSTVEKTLQTVSTLEEAIEALKNGKLVKIAEDRRYYYYLCLGPKKEPHFFPGSWSLAGLTPSSLDETEKLIAFCSLDEAKRLIAFSRRTKRVKIEPWLPNLCVYLVNRAVIEEA